MQVRTMKLDGFNVCESLFNSNILTWYWGQQGIWAHDPYTSAVVAVVTSSTPTSSAVVTAGGLSCVPMKLAPPSSLCTSEVRWDLGGAFLHYIFILPPGPHSGGVSVAFVLLF